MKITYEKPTLLNVDDLFRFMKKFYKDYECGGKLIKKKKLIKELKGEGLHYIFLIKVDNELAGFDLKYSFVLDFLPNHIP